MILLLLIIINLKLDNITEIFTTIASTHTLTIAAGKVNITLAILKHYGLTSMTLI